VTRSEFKSKIKQAPDGDTVADDSRRVRPTPLCRRGRAVDYTAAQLRAGCRQTLYQFVIALAAGE